MDPKMTPITPRAGFSSDLTDFVVSPVVINDAMGNQATEFYLGGNYHFLITFQETAALQFEYYHDAGSIDYMTYQLPPQLTVPSMVAYNSPYPIFGESSTPGGIRPVIGFYSIEPNGQLKVHFDNVDKYGNPAMIWDDGSQRYVPVNFIDYYSDAAFTLDINAQFENAGAGQQINFGNNVSRTVTVLNPLAGPLSIAKTGTVDPAGQTVTFTVIINDLSGQVNNIILNDFEPPGLNGWLPSALFQAMTVSIDGGQPYTPPEFAGLQGQPFGAGFSLDFSGVTLGSLGQIVVTFTLDVADVIIAWAAANPSTAGTYNFDFWLHNRAVAQGTGTPPVSADYNARLQRQFFQKTGAQDPGYIYTALWSNWSVGDNMTPLNGSSVTDTFTGLMFSDNNPQPQIGNGVTATFLDPAGEPIADWYIPVAPGATGFSFTVPSDNEPVVTGLRGDGVYVQGLGAHAVDNAIPYGPIVTVIVQPFRTTVSDPSDFDNNVTNTYYNTITVDIQGEQPSYTANVSISRLRRPVLDKTMLVASNIATTAVIINPDELTLADGAGMYTATDILSDTLALYLSSVVVEAWDGSAWVPHTLTNSTSGDLWTYTLTGSNQINMVVPDSTMLRVTYLALVRGNVDDAVPISNIFNATAQYHASAGETFIIPDTNGSASMTGTALTVFKYDQELPDQSLSGGIFALYTDIQYPGWDTVPVPSGVNRTITVGTTVFYYLGNGTTDANGRLIFDNPWLAPTHGGIYALVELRPPIGYQMPADPLTLFAYTVPTPGQLAALGNHPVQQVADTVPVSDTALPLLSAVIDGFKTVVGANPPERVFTFQLTEVADAGGTPLPDPYTDSTITIGQGPFGFALQDLMPDTTYYFKITEDVDPTDPNWIYDPNATTGHIVTVTVGPDGTATVIYPGGANQVNFTNTVATGAASADLAVTKTAGQTSVQPGGTLTYTVTTTNHGPDDAQDVTVTDTMPAVLTNQVFSVDNGGSWQPWTGSHVYGPLANGSSFTLLLRGTVRAAVAGSITNTAVVSSTTEDPVLTNNTSTAVTPIVPAAASADLVIFKSADLSTVQPGGTLTYTVTSVNNGPDGAQDVTVTDDVPAALTGVLFSLDGAAWHPWPGSHAIGTLTYNHSFTILLRGTVSATAAGSISNTAAVTSTTPDPDLTNNSRTVVTTVTPAALSADLAVTMSGAPSSVRPDDTLTYTVTTVNNGPDAAQNVTVVNAMPAVLTNAVFSSNNGINWQPWTGSYAHGALANGASFALLLRGTVSANATGSISNTAVVNSTTPDPNLTNNSATVVTPVSPTALAADLAVTMSGAPASVRPGDTLTYTVTTRNNGPDAAQNVMVTDALPAALTNAQFSANDGVNWLPWTGSFAHNTLANGASFTLLIRSTVSDAATGSIANTVVVSSTTPDPNLNNNTAVTTTLVAGNEADLAVIKTACPTSVAPCGRISYTMVVSNSGPNEAVNVRLTDLIPIELCKVQYSLDGRRWSQWCPWHNDLLLGNLAPNASVTVMVRGVVHRCAAVDMTNTVTVTSATPDPDLNNNHFTVTTRIRKRRCRR